MKSRLCPIVFFLSLSSAVSAQLCVRASAPPGGNGSSWNAAFNSLQDALDYAAQFSQSEIHIAEGVYVPSKRQNLSDPRSATFRLAPGVSLLGGFKDDGSARDPQRYETILSGDVLGDDPPFPVPDPGIYNNWNIDWNHNRDDNVYHVVTVVESRPMYSTVLDGLTVAGGDYSWANYPEARGAGVLCENADVWLRDVRLIDNHSVNGGGLWAQNTAVRMERCRVEYNTATNGAGLFISTNNHDITIRNCSFENNAAYERLLQWTGRGAAAHIFGHKVQIDSCIVNCQYATSGAGFTVDSVDGTKISRSIFTYNWGYFGSALLTGTSLTLEDCDIYYNHGGLEVLSVHYSTPDIHIRRCRFRGNLLWGSNGGGAVAIGAAHLFVSDSEFEGNSARDGGAGGAIYSLAGELSIKNTTFANNWSATSGGAVFAQGDDPVRFLACLFRSNNSHLDYDYSTEYLGGGAVSLPRGGAVFSRCNF